MKDLDRDVAFWLLSVFCGNILSSVKRIDFGDKLQSVCYDYIHHGCKSRTDYEYLVENYRRFQKLSKDYWIIEELLK